MSSDHNPSLRTASWREILSLALDLQRTQPQLTRGQLITGVLRTVRGSMLYSLYASPHSSMTQRELQDAGLAHLWAELAGDPDPTPAPKRRGKAKPATRVKPAAQVTTRGSFMALAESLADIDKICTLFRVSRAQLLQHNGISEERLKFDADTGRHTPGWMESPTAPWAKR